MQPVEEQKMCSVFPAYRCLGMSRPVHLGVPSPAATVQYSIHGCAMHYASQDCDYPSANCTIFVGLSYQLVQWRSYRKMLCCAV